jgi:hypothetical protein
MMLDTARPATRIATQQRITGARRITSAMISDPDIYRAAKLVIDQHGDDAAIRAAERADELLEAASRAARRKLR